jgi:hypothetical protein
MKHLLRSTTAAIALVSATAISSGATTIQANNSGSPTSIGLGGSDLLGQTEFPSSPFTVDYYFIPTGSLTFSANATETTSAGADSINPFEIQLFQQGNSTALATSSGISVNGSTEQVALSNVALSSGVTYFVEVTGTVNSSFSVTGVPINGNVFLTATPLPGGLALFAPVMVGFWAWAKRRKWRGPTQFASA